MLRLQNLRSGLVLVIIIFAQTAGLAFNGLEAGKKFYAEGKFDKAAKCFESVISNSPKDASAHYLLGNSYLALKQAPAAINEYLAAVQLDSTGTAGRYSRQALSSLYSPTAAASSAKPATEEKVVLTDARETQNSTRAISRQADEQAQRATTECDAKVKRMLEEGNGRVKKLELEMKERITANGEPAWSGSPSCNRSVKYYDPEPENNIIREEYAPKIEAIKQEYKKRTNEILAMYKRQSSAVEDSAITLDSSYLRKSSSVKLNPLRSDMYVRSYETSDAASGGQVPVQAAQAKALRTPSSTK